MFIFVLALNESIQSWKEYCVVKGSIVPCCDHMKSYSHLYLCQKVLGFLSTNNVLILCLQIFIRALSHLEQLTDNS